MTLPRWDSQDQRDVEAMTRWVNDELNRLDMQAMRADIKGENAPSDYVQWAIEQADSHTNIEPLKQAFPELARFFAFPTRKHGQRGEGRGYNPVKGMAADVKRIRALWKQHYGDKRRTTAPSAEDIAAQRWGIDR